MREILFRGIQADTGEQIYGYGAIDDDILHLDLVMGIVRVKCAKDTIGQFTGLTDKNGTKIFEGDICNWKSTVYSNAVPYVANYSNSDCRFVLRGKVDTIPMWDGLEIETISNIHDKE